MSEEPTFSNGTIKCRSCAASIPKYSGNVVAAGLHGGICAACKLEGVAEALGDVPTGTWSTPAAPAKAPRCLITGNLCGTDTRPVINGKMLKCECKPCQAYEPPPSTFEFPR